MSHEETRGYNMSLTEIWFKLVLLPTLSVLLSTTKQKPGFSESTFASGLSVL